MMFGTPPPLWLRRQSQHYHDVWHPPVAQTTASVNITMMFGIPLGLRRQSQHYHDVWHAPVAQKTDSTLP